MVPKWSSDVDYILPWLSADSVVVEVGAYRGDWVYEVATRYRCTVHAFEPATLALEFLQKKVGKMDNVTIHPVALGRDNGEVLLHNCQRDGASVYATIGKSETVQCVDVTKTIAEIGQIDLIHLNAEGSELDILDCLLSTGQVSDIERIMVQWHVLNRKDTPKISHIASRLLKTHMKQNGYRAWNLYQLRRGAEA